ncbi:hypothetical protein F183_A09210 [Bryobacterales bacterium F-183]|nr:hypothetical protein F183_A09210 [Bryobacterales bacterium F-183]
MYWPVFTLLGGAYLIGVFFTVRAVFRYTEPVRGRLWFVFEGLCIGSLVPYMLFLLLLLPFGWLEEATGHRASEDGQILMRAGVAFGVVLAITYAIAHRRKQLGVRP